MNIIVQPYKSRVFIDETFIGQSPETVQLDPGRYRLTVREFEEESLLWDTTIQICPNGPEKISHIISPGISLAHQAFHASRINWIQNNQLIYFDRFDEAIKKVHKNYHVEAYKTGSYLSSFTMNQSGSSGFGFNASVYGDLPFVYQFESNELIELEYLSLCATWLPSGDKIGILGYPKEEPLDNPVLFEVDLESGPAIRHKIDSDLSCQSIRYSSSGDWFFYHNGIHLQIHSVNTGLLLEKVIDDVRLVTVHPNDEIVSWLSSEDELMVLYLEEDFKPKTVGAFHNVTHVNLLDDWIYFVQSSDEFRNMSYWRLNYTNGALQLVLPSNLILGQILEIETSPDHSLVAYINHVDSLFIYTTGN
jgi:hypothetical protein